MQSVTKRQVALRQPTALLALLIAVLSFALIAKPLHGHQLRVAPADAELRAATAVAPCVLCVAAHESATIANDSVQAAVPPVFHLAAETLVAPLPTLARSYSSRAPPSV